VQRKKRSSHSNQERWLVSYADFITLMFAFFVVLFASSQVDRKKVASISAYFESYIRGQTASAEQISPARDFEGLPPDASLLALTAEEMAPVETQLSHELALEIGQGKVSMSMQPRGLVLSLRESALFPPGRATFNPDAVPLLTKIAYALKKLPYQPVRLEGHSDNRPIQTAEFPSNWELSAARAVAVMELLHRQFQIAPQRLGVAGYADYHPVASNDLPEGRARNRRVDIVVLSRSAAQMEPQQAVSTEPSSR
jgi:chemotaxis protein MotB